MATIVNGNKFHWQFEITDRIGSGGNSTVYKAYTASDLSRPFALKLFDDPANSGKKLARFHREVTVVESLLGNSGCSELIDHGICEERPFYIMPYYSGGDLHKRFMKNPQNPVPVDDILKIFCRVVETVANLHSPPKILAVRDLKPQNILLTESGDPIVCDFGLALWANTPDDDRLTTQKAVGSSGYRPPEWDSAYPDSLQISGDIWSLGRTLWALLASKAPPNNYESLGTTALHLKNWLEDNHIAEAIQGLVNQCTRFKNSERPSASELLGSIRVVMDYCNRRKNGTTDTSLDERLATIAVRLPGSDVIANAAQKKTELDSKLNEIKDCQSILIETLRKFQPKLAEAFQDTTGKFGVFGREPRRTEVSWIADAYIAFHPNQDLIETGFAREIRYTFEFGLNSDGNFSWSEISQMDGHSSHHSFLTPRSLTTLAAQKCGQIESILVEQLLPEIERMLTRSSNIAQPNPAEQKYVSALSKGTVVFDYSLNNGCFRIGDAYWTFDTKWSKSSDQEIYCYADQVNVAGIAIAKDVTEIAQISDPAQYDFSTHVRTVKLGQVLVWRSKLNFYAAAKINSISDDTRGQASDGVKFDYVILTDQSVDFSKKK